MAPHMVKTQIICGETIVSGPPHLINSQSSLSEGAISPEVKSPTTERNSELQLWFEDAISKSMKIPDRYLNVTVKLISWCKDLDDLKCEDEVQELSKLLREDFRFHVEHTKLNNNRPPQQQLNAAIHSFVYEHDGPYNLLLVYYAGHGSFNDTTSQLIFSASNEHPDTNPAQATWGPVEQTLMDTVEGDVLVILDCCYASDIQRNLTHGNKTYEMLAASNRNNTTPRPGPKSFTRDLMRSLRELLEDFSGNHFTTYDLLTKISPKRPVGLEPVLHNRRFRVDTALSGRHIRLAPHKAQDEGRTGGFPPHNTDMANLTLAFELDQRSLDKDEIERLAKGLPAVFKKAKIPLRRVHFRGVEPRVRPLRHKVQAIAGLQGILHRVRMKRSNRLGGVTMAATGAPVDTNNTLEIEIQDKEALGDEDSKVAFAESPCPTQAAPASVTRHSQRLLDKMCSINKPMPAVFTYDIYD